MNQYATCPLPAPLTSQLVGGRGKDENMATTYFVPDGYSADGAPNPPREVEVIKWPEAGSINCICRIKYLDDGSECFAPKYSLTERVAT